jgi:hypothetical protein
MNFSTLSKDIPLEIKNVAGNQKKFKIALKKTFYTLIHFTQWNSTLVNHELCTVSRDFLLEWYIDLRFYVHYVSTLGFFFKLLSRYIMYLFIDLYSELTTFPCINLICLIYVL